MKYADIGELLRFGTDAECRETLVMCHDLGFHSETDIADEKEMKRLERREESLEEQICFARTLLDEIEEACRVHNRAADLKKAIARLMEDSSFER